MPLTWSLMPDDRTRNFELSGIYELPFGKGKKYATNGVGSAIAGGWQTNWVFSRYSGTPFTIYAPGASPNPPGNSQIPDRGKSKLAIYGARRHVSPNFHTSASPPVRQ